MKITIQPLLWPPVMHMSLYRAFLLGPQAIGPTCLQTHLFVFRDSHVLSAIIGTVRMRVLVP